MDKGKMKVIDQSNLMSMSPFSSIGPGTFESIQGKSAVPGVSSIKRKLLKKKAAGSNPIDAIRSTDDTAGKMVSAIRGMRK